MAPERRPDKKTIIKAIKKPEIPVTGWSFQVTPFPPNKATSPETSAKGIIANRRHIISFFIE